MATKKAPKKAATPLQAEDKSSRKSIPVTDDMMHYVADLKFRKGLSDKEIMEVLQEKKILAKPSVKPKKLNTSTVSEYIRATGEWLLDRSDELWRRMEIDHRSLKLADQFVRRFGLKEVIISTPPELSSFDDAANTRRVLAMAGAYYIETLMDGAEKSGETVHIAFSGGQAVFELASALSEQPRPSTHFYAAAALGRDLRMKTGHVAPDTNATVAWLRSGRDPRQLHYVTIPPFAADGGTIEEQLTEFMGNSAVAAGIRRTAASVNVVIGSLGVIDHTLEGVDIESKVSIQALIKHLGMDMAALTKRDKAIGDFCYNVFDRDGNDLEKWRFAVTLGAGTNTTGIRFYQKLVEDGKTVIVLAGSNKIEQLLVAMEKRMFNVLVTDQETMVRLLELKTQ